MVHKYLGEEEKNMSREVLKEIKLPGERLLTDLGCDDSPDKGEKDA